MDNILRYKKIKRRNKFKAIESESNKQKNIDIQILETIGPEIIKKALSSEKTLFFSLLIFRIINSLLNHTSYVPDEYWQSVEVAHKWIFGIGHLTWEWLPELALRSPLYPLLFAIPFKVLFFLGCDNRILLIKLPMLIHGCFAAIGDYYLYSFSFRLAGQEVAQWTLFNQLLNWFTMYSCTRTLINNIEWVLVILALHECQVLKETSTRHLSRKLLFFTGMCFILRPTGLVVLLPLCIYHLSTQLSKTGDLWSAISKTFVNCFLIGTFSLVISLLVDKHFYGKWTCSQWNFFHLNLLTDISQNYGVHPWHWYISNAVPSMLLTQTFILVFSFWSEWRDPDSRCMIILLGIVIHMYSLLGHKEFRFIFPLLPIAMHLIGRAFVRITSKRKVLVCFLLITQIPMSLYMCLIHQRGGNDVVMSIGRFIDQSKVSPSNVSFVFLMPCHSTPWSSHMHYNISIRFLTCHPQITGSINLLNEPLKASPILKDYDEADLFYANPRKWLLEEYSKLDIRPSHWVMFDKLSPEINELLIQWNYRICKQYFHAHFPTHSRHSHRILVYCSQSSFL